VELKSTPFRWLDMEYFMLKTDENEFNHIRNQNKEYLRKLSENQNPLKRQRKNNYFRNK